MNSSQVLKGGGSHFTLRNPISYKYKYRKADMSLGRPILEMCKQGEIGFMPPEAGHYWGGISQLSLPPSQEKAKKWNGGNFENLENIRQLVSDKFEANGKTIDDKTKIKMENTAQFLGYYANTIPFWFTDRT